MASSLTPQQISPRTEKWIRFSAIAVMFIVAVASMVLSFDGLRKLATEASISDQLAFLFPVIVDGTIIMASLAILRMNLSGQRAVLGWVTMILGTGLSIAGNVISVRNEGIIAMGTHALPPILLATSLELFLSLIRTNIRLAQEAQDVEVKIKQASEEKTLSPVEQRISSAPAEDKPMETQQEEVPTANLVHAPTINKEEAKTEEPPTVVKESVAEIPVITQPITEEPLSVERISDIMPERIEEESDGPKIVFETVLAPQKQDESNESDDAVSNDAVSEKPAVAVIDSELESVDKPVEIIEAEPSLAPSPVLEAEVKPMTETSADNIVDPVDESAVETSVEPVRKPAPRSKPDNENVVNYKKVLEKIKPEASRNSKIAAILNRYPDAKANDMKKAIGDPANTRYDESIKQAKAFLAQRAQQKAKTQ